MRRLLLLIPAFAFLAACGGESTPAESANPAENSTPAASPSEQPKSETAAPAQTIYLTGKLNGEDWKAGVMQVGNMFWKKGVKIMKFDTPTLQLTFTSANGGDTRQILVYIENFNGAAGEINPKNLTINVSGVDDDEKKTSYFANYDKDSGKPFSFKLTKYEVTSPTEAIMSGEFSGNVPGSLGSPGVDLQNCVFTDVKASISEQGI